MNEVFITAPLGFKEQRIVCERALGRLRVLHAKHRQHADLVFFEWKRGDYTEPGRFLRFKSKDAP